MINKWIIYFFIIIFITLSLQCSGNDKIIYDSGKKEVIVLSLEEKRIRKDKLKKFIIKLKFEFSKRRSLLDIRHLVYEDFSYENEYKFELVISYDEELANLKKIQKLLNYKELIFVLKNGQMESGRLIGSIGMRIPDSMNRRSKKALKFRKMPMITFIYDEENKQWLLKSIYYIKAMSFKKQ